VAENLPDQNFVADRPDQVWLADITYTPTGEAGSTCLWASTCLPAGGRLGHARPRAPN
jgi:transposase InsO family protein